MIFPPVWFSVQELVATNRADKSPGYITRITDPPRSSLTGALMTGAENSGAGRQFRRRVRREFRRAAGAIAARV